MDKKEREESVRFRFGEKIRAIRERKGLTMKEVGSRAGVSESLISQIERDRVSPSLDTLIGIAEVLQIDLEYLFADLKKTNRVSIVREKERHVMIQGGVRYEQLTTFVGEAEKHALEAFTLTVEPGSEKGDTSYGHPGQELGFIIEGEAELFYGTEQYRLEKGDSVSFASDIPHALRNTGKKELRALWVVTPPRLFGSKNRRN
jgi:transcriptional regulator with XRE-family HTH domain